jgi:hypothetical protein
LIRADRPIFWRRALLAAKQKVPLNQGGRCLWNKFLDNALAPIKSAGLSLTVKDASR